MGAERSGRVGSWRAEDPSDVDVIGDNPLAAAVFADVEEFAGAAADILVEEEASTAPEFTPGDGALASAWTRKVVVLEEIVEVFYESAVTPHPSRNDGNSGLLLHCSKTSILQKALKGGRRYWKAVARFEECGFER